MYSCLFPSGHICYVCVSQGSFSSEANLGKLRNQMGVNCLSLVPIRSISLASSDPWEVSLLSPLVSTVDDQNFVTLSKILLFVIFFVEL